MEGKDTHEPGEKRGSIRQRRKLRAFLKIRTYLQGPAYAKDISLDGICLETFNLFNRIMPHRAVDLQGSPARVTIPGCALSLHGIITRIDPLSGEIALAIERTSDDLLWHKICANTSDGAP